MCLTSPFDTTDMMGDSVDDDAASTEQFDDETIDLEREYSKELVLTLKVRSQPGPVANLTVRISTILGVLKWDFDQNNTGGYPLKSFTAQFRRYYDVESNCSNSSNEWDRLDPRNIPTNVVS